MSLTKFAYRELILLGACGFSAVFAYSLVRRLTTSKKISQGGSKSPNEGWKVGENQPIPYDKKEYSSYSPEELRKSGGLYGLSISAVVPRPIALVSSQDANGIVNCAPYSYFNVVSHDPPLVVIGNCINMRTKTKKDTLKNIEETGKHNSSYSLFEL
jgi:hypothetical protein